MKSIAKFEGKAIKGSFTYFFDMSSGGGSKLDTDNIYIEAKKSLAKVVFERVFDRDPENVTCQCCGCDYSIDTKIDPEIPNGSFVITKQDIENILS